MALCHLILCFLLPSKNRPVANSFLFPATQQVFVCLFICFLQRAWTTTSCLNICESSWWVYKFYKFKFANHKPAKTCHELKYLSLFLVIASPKLAPLIHFRWIAFYLYIGESNHCGKIEDNYTVWHLILVCGTHFFIMYWFSKPWRLQIWLVIYWTIWYVKNYKDLAISHYKIVFLNGKQICIFKVNELENYLIECANNWR